ncbi:MAG: Uma2 family endonuclease [Planctomycetia bacterium]|nr:Uma2 family endonuclease [Planctomycetia bacterium]
MNTTTVPPATPASAPTPQTKALLALLDYAQPGFRLSLGGVRYADYEQLLQARTDAGRAGVKIAFDRGEMEIMVVGSTHERLKKIVALLIEVWLEETSGAYLPSGGMTHKRADLEKGFEPDECYYVQNWGKVAGTREIDFTKDPPPDLTVKIEVSRTVLNRLPIYAAFKIPEVWRYNGERLAVLLLQPDGSYRESSVSRALPTLPITEVPRYLALADDVSLDFVTIRRRFGEWVRSLPAAPAAPTAPNP